MEMGVEDCLGGRYLFPAILRKFNTVIWDSLVNVSVSLPDQLVGHVEEAFIRTIAF